MHTEILDAIIRRVLKIQADAPIDDLRLGDIPAWDSLTHMDLILSIETDLGLLFTGDEIAEMISVQAIRSIVAAKGACA